MDIKTKLKRLRKASNQTQQQIADMLNVGQVTYARYENGSRSPSNDLLIKLAQIFNVTTDYLLGINNELNNNEFKPYIRIPVLGRIPAGMPLNAIEEVLDYEELSLDTYSPTKEYFGLKIVGDSMSPKYLSNDIVIVEKVSDCDSGKDCIVMVDGQDATFKKVIKKDDGIVLQPINPNYNPMFYSIKEIEHLPVTILGIVVEIRRTV